METFQNTLLIAIFVAVCILNRNLNQKVRKIMSTLQERFDAVVANQTTASEQLNTTGTELTEASAEILSELGKLREGGGLTPEAEASLKKIEANAAAVKDTADALAQTATALANVSPPIEG